MAFSIYLMLNQQTIIPDEIHLWLASSEFINKERDLPHDLQLMLTRPSVHIHWTDNTYCFKRHNIFNIFQNKNMYCFMIDDDVCYNNNLIESTLKLSDKYPNAIINYTEYGQIYYTGKHQSHKFPSYTTPTPNNRWCGQSMIPSWIYPMDTFNMNYIKLRDKYCPVCDETWLTQFFIKHNIGIVNNHLPWGKELNSYNCNTIGLVSKVNQLDANGLNFRDRCLIDIFEHVFPENKQYYMKYFNYK